MPHRRAEDGVWDPDTASCPLSRNPLPELPNAATRAGLGSTECSVEQSRVARESRLVHQGVPGRVGSLAAGRGDLIGGNRGALNTARTRLTTDRK